MKICAIICEFNPFHNGHKYLIETAKKLSGCDSVLCIMSGNFTQRGDICLLNKFKRARHAVLSGADAVLELPAPFAVAPAEIFAQGAIKILSSIPEVTTLAFGCEDCDKGAFLQSAELLINEPKEFTAYLNEQLNLGESYIKSYNYAFEKCGGKHGFLSMPNNILGVEYTKAILKYKSEINILPIRRIGCGYNDENLAQNYSSASAIRQNLNSDKVINNVPNYVYCDLKIEQDIQRIFKNYCLFSLLSTNKEQLKEVFGCTEGLENKLKNCEMQDFESIIANTCAKRYSASRIKRILCANLLKLYKYDALEFLQNDLYLKPLAINKDKIDLILSSLSKSSFPTVILQKNKNSLSVSAKKCFEICEFADKIWDFINNKKTYNYTFISV
ncbi:MAG: nucleotidyltransferase family protein [Clostridiales bacterium]|nr:nucleotidyltransferase family protein [Clostridiales bacterium]